MRKLKWASQEALAIKRTFDVRREEYLDYMTFQGCGDPLFTEIWGPMVGLKEEWEEQDATPEELDFSAFRYRHAAMGVVPVKTGRNGAYPGYAFGITNELRIALKQPVPPWAGYVPTGRSEDTLRGKVDDSSY